MRCGHLFEVIRPSATRGPLSLSTASRLAVLSCMALGVNEQPQPRTRSGFRAVAWMPPASNWQSAVLGIRCPASLGIAADGDIMMAVAGCVFTGEEAGCEPGETQCNGGLTCLPRSAYVVTYSGEQKHARAAPESVCVCVCVVCLSR
jgi:hypothetical protein